MTLEELKKIILETRARTDHLRDFLDVPGKRAALTEAEARMGQPGFWDRREEAQATVQKVSGLKNVLASYDRVAGKVDDLQVLLELAQTDPSDASLLAEAAQTSSGLDQELSRVELASFLSGKFDRNNAIVNLHAGSGGTESCDWTGMLFRMYTRWFEHKGFTYEVADIQPGEEAGLKSATLMVAGEFAFGYLKAERGVHRLVRISPFDANKRRHTSFAAVDVLAEIDDDIQIEIREEDLKTDTYRSSGAGGQYVNRTDSAVRITHLPTGIIVASQQERSQHKNRAQAMKILKAKLYEREEEKKRKEQAGTGGEKKDNEWGSQIRSYVLQPYQMVKDLRTGVQTSNTSAVLDGDLDAFAEAFLRGERRETAGKDDED
ncbi:MAG: peptide chain release factor 2 [Lentisphaeria bacterium]